MKELIYASNTVEKLIKNRFPNAVFKDARDCVHEERFEVDIEDCTEDEFYPFAMREGFAGCCFGLGLVINIIQRENKDKIKRWLKESKKTIDEGTEWATYENSHPRKDLMRTIIKNGQS